MFSHQKREKHSANFHPHNNFHIRGKKVQEHCDDVAVKKERENIALSKLKSMLLLPQIITLFR